jgi:hypothetical protein
MASRRHGIPAHQLAHDIGTLLADFTGQVDAFLARTAIDSPLPAPQIRREVCAAVWAALTAAFEASAMSQEEKNQLTSLLREKMQSFWQRHCASEPGVAQELPELASRYLAGRDPRSHVVTATQIVHHLLARIGADAEPAGRLARQLVPLFAHRMLGDTWHLNDLKSRVGIQLPLIATLCFTAGITQAVEPALRLLRLA